MELQGCRFGRLTVKCRAASGSRVAWLCICDCGTEVIKAQVDLRSGDTKSCGCLRSDTNKKRNETHGMSYTPAYAKWLGMKARTNHPDRKGNKCYAEVVVCARWRKFENFYKDMGDPPAGYSLDRKDNSKGYSKKNCRWVPLVEQSRNTRRLRLHEGVCLSQAARENGLPANVVFDRVNKLGWSIEDALSTPKRKQRKSNA